MWGDAADEEWLDGDVGGGTVLAVPVSDERGVVGAIVVRRPGGAPPPGALHGLRALAPVTGSALAAASTHRGAVDASMADPLTALPNRRRLDLDLAAIGTTGRFAAAMVDVDQFKHFNDTNGHVAGDLALQLVARALSSAVRAGDTVYRYGGEEFCILLPRADRADAEEIAERLLATLRGTVVPGGEHQPGGGVTASVGLAVRRPGQRPDQVLVDADVALYAAKRAGRDRAVVATHAAGSAG